MTDIKERKPVRYVNVIATVEMMIQSDGPVSEKLFETQLETCNWKHVSNIQIVHETWD